MDYQLSKHFAPIIHQETIRKENITFEEIKVFQSFSICLVFLANISGFVFKKDISQTLSELWLNFLALFYKDKS